MVRILRVRKDDKGDILAVFTELYMVKTVAEVVRDIENKTATYYVQEQTPRAEVHVVTEYNGKKYIRTNADRTSKNNLDNLPTF